MRKYIFSFGGSLHSVYFAATMVVFLQVSISPAVGKQVLFYEDINGQGDVLKVDLKPGECYNFPHEWNDRASSVNTQDACILVYEHAGCNGKIARIAPGTPHHGHLPSLGINDEITSTKLCDNNEGGNNEGSGNDDDIKRAALEEHNKRRRRHGTPNLVWSDSISQKAQKYAEYLAANDKFEHSGNGLGENLAANGVSDKAGAVRMAVVQWYDNEEPKYDYNKPGFSMETGHFTQVVWRDSKELGVGIAWNPKKRWWVIVANYNPAGNGGMYAENVPRPMQ